MDKFQAEGKDKDWYEAHENSNIDEGKETTQEQISDSYKMGTIEDGERNP